MPDIANPVKKYDDWEERCKTVLFRAVRGEHHLPSGWKKFNNSIEANIFDGISTFDFDVLTRLVIGAHDHCVRVEICQSGPNKIKVRLCPRQRDGVIYDRHPTIEQATEDYRAGRL